ncbi:MAG: hypothetical protein L3J35_07455 [Bacteroidales bacterium]|nr:hypothetical protein [Bacteroidales bacterium]
MKMFQHKFTDEKKSVKKDIKNIKLNRLPIIVILDRITDIGNAGMIFRLADALRIKKVYLYKYDKEFNVRLLYKKSRATINYVDFEYLNNIKKIIKLKEDYKLITLDKTNKSTPYYVYNNSTPTCLILGAERTGVSQELIEISDFSLHLPMNGINTSINVATAASVVLYHIADNLNKK